MSHSNHDELYRHARIYDVAFSYRDFESEVDFLVAAARRFGRDPKSFLEVAAGPGVHALVAAKRGLRAAALDLSESMMARCAAKAKELGVVVETMVADMTRFACAPVDLVFNPITSISYLRTREALVEHMKSVAKVLAPGGVYVVENNHPKDFLKHEHFVPSIWTMREDKLTVTTTWIAEAPPKMNSAHQLYEAVARYDVDDDGTKSMITDRAWLRMVFPDELALAAAAAELEEVAVLGSLDVDAPFNDDGWRAVSVFRRR